MPLTPTLSPDGGEGEECRAECHVGLRLRFSVFREFVPPSRKSLFPQQRNGRKRTQRNQKTPLPLFPVKTRNQHLRHGRTMTRQNHFMGNSGHSPWPAI
jgi:hypothetical protein